ncbi:MAG: 2-amino-4-hydroxy-6-hydroxymethyldihydropteridine diphosphokinase [Prevotella sp.]|nr:2-amino-4-hydroxy-6-hydroxymethyldihydropteridine diphosphokinase [Prevotella sp.]
MPRHAVLISIGSNSRQSAHVQWASQRLSLLLGSVRLSRVIWTRDVKGTGAFYMNRLVSGTTTLSVVQIEQKLKELEAATGRREGTVTLDLDLMQYDDERRHLRDWPRPYIQQLIGDCALQ